MSEKKPKQPKTQEQRQASGKDHKSNQTRDKRPAPNQPESQSTSSSKKTKRTPSPKFIRNWCVVILILTFLLEFLCSCFGAPFIIIPLAGAMVSFLGSVIVTLFKKDGSTSDKQPRTEDGFEDRLKLGFHNIIYRIFDDVIALVIFCTAVSLLISSGLASVHTVGHISQALSGAFHEIMPSEDEPHLLPNANVAPEPTEVNEAKEPAPSASPANPTPAAVTPYFTILNPDLEKSLGDGERDLLFFLSGDYFIDDWENQDAVIEKVKQKIDSKRSEQNENEFDNEAPESIKGEISRVSDLEAVLANSEQLDEIIAVRESTYEDYPMYRLAKLLAESYSTYGLAYDSLENSICATEYYYAHSIIWYNEALTYEKTGEPVNELLRMIAARYHDLAAVLPSDSPYQQYASKLSAAYYAIMNSGEYADSASSQ